MVPAADIVRHHQHDPDHTPWVDGPPPAEPVTIVGYDPGWPNRFERSASGVLSAPGPTVMDIDHIASTSVPGLAAKNVIDISMTVRNPADEEAYVPALRSIGYVLAVREPSWHEHRPPPRSTASQPPRLRPGLPRVHPAADVLRLVDQPPRRPDPLRARKVPAIPGGGHVMDCNRREQAVIREIYERAFRDAGLL